MRLCMLSQNADSNIVPAAERNGRKDRSRDTEYQTSISDYAGTFGMLILQNLKFHIAHSRDATEIPLSLQTSPRRHLRGARESAPVGGLLRYAFLSHTSAYSRKDARAIIPLLFANQKAMIFPTVAEWRKSNQVRYCQNRLPAPLGQQDRHPARNESVRENADFHPEMTERRC